jgi:hypothetical protein
VTSQVDFEHTSSNSPTAQAHKTSIMASMGGAPSWRNRGELALTLCHDVRAPLDRLAGLANLLRDRGGPIDGAAVSGQILAYTEQLDALVGTIVELIDTDETSAGVPTHASRVTVCHGLEPAVIPYTA